MIHLDFVEFWTKHNKTIETVPLPLDSIGERILIVYYHSGLSINGLPLLHNIVAFEYPDKSITYKINDINYSENQMLKVMKLSTFI